MCIRDRVKVEKAGVKQKTTKVLYTDGTYAFVENAVLFADVPELPDNLNKVE